MWRSLCVANCVAALLFPLTIRLPLQAQVNVLTQHNDNSRTGQNTNETLLTPSNVNPNSFALLQTVHVDGNIYAQPLVLTGVPIAGGTHDVVFVATAGDSVYALDAYSGTQYWRVSLGTPVQITDIPGGCLDVAPQVGITSTPVIDPAAGKIFVVANTIDPDSTYHYRLHSLDVTTGADTTTPTDIVDPGNTFNALYQNQRTGLLLTNGHLVFGFSSHCDNPPWYGYVFSYNASTLAQENVFVPVPTSQGEEAGVWAADTGLAADSSGNIYLVTGNGNFDGVTAFGDSIIKLPPPPGGGSSWAPSDYYTPADQGMLNFNDLDLGSGGVVLLPDLIGSGTQLLVQAGKEGTISIVNRNSMGEYNGPNGPNNIFQELTNANALPGGDAESGMYGVPTYWNGTIYFSALRDYVRSYSFDVSSGAVAPLGASGFKCNGGSTSGEPHYSCPTSISSSGTSNGILWALESHSPTGWPILHALDASSLTELYSSAWSGGDIMNAIGVNFLTPTVANGHVYVGAGNGANPNPSGMLGIYGPIYRPSYYSDGSYPNQQENGSLTGTGGNIAASTTYQYYDAIPCCEVQEFGDVTWWGFPSHIDANDLTLHVQYAYGGPTGYPNGYYYSISVNQTTYYSGMIGNRQQDATVTIPAGTDLSGIQVEVQLQPGDDGYDSTSGGVGLNIFIQ